MIFTVTDLAWRFDPAQGPVVELAGRVDVFKKIVAMRLVPLDDGEWGLLGKPRFSGVPVPMLERREVVQQLVNIAAKSLRTTNLWPIEQVPGGARLEMNELKVPDEVEFVFVSMRMNAPEPSPQTWKDMWKRIEGRVAFDRNATVNGYSDSEVRRSLAALQPHFPAEWVKKRYSSSRLDGDGRPEHLNAIPFPAYQLARLASGAICIDPGLSCLIDVGLSIGELKNIEGFKRMLNQVTRSEIMQQICLAACLLRDRKLISVEQPTGLGHARHDLAVRVGEIEVDVEMKVKTSPSLARRVADDLRTLQRQVPPSAVRPAVLFLLLAGENELLPQEELRQLVQAAVENAAPAIAAIVIGHAFTDSRGGRIQREVLAVGVNSNAKFDVDADEISHTFTSLRAPIVYPHSGATTLFTFGTDSDDPAP